MLVAAVAPTEGGGVYDLCPLCEADRAPVTLETAARVGLERLVDQPAVFGLTYDVNKRSVKGSPVVYLQFDLR